MEIKIEDGRYSVWDSFRTKVEDMFVTGYNLPTVLQLTAVREVEDKLTVWKGKLSFEQEIDPTFGHGGVEKVSIVEPCEKPEVPLNDKVQNVESTGEEQILTSQIDLEEEVGYEDATIDPEMMTDAQNMEFTTTVEEVISVSPQLAAGENSLTDLMREDLMKNNSDIREESFEVVNTPSPTVVKRKRGRPPGSTKKIKTEPVTPKRKTRENNSVEKDESLESPDEAGTDDLNPQPSTAPRKRGRPPGSTKKNTPKPIKQEKIEEPPVEQDTDWAPDIDPDEFSTPVRKKRGRPRGSTGKRRAVKSIRVQDLDEKLHMCDVCNKSLRTKEKLDFHMLRHRTGPIKCPNCPKEFQSTHGYEVHMRLHTGKGLNKCMFCNYVTGSNGMLTSHITRVHEKLRKHLCETCGKGFVTAYMLKRHIEAIHMRDVFKDTYTCPACDYKTHSDACLKSHIRNRHTKTPGYVCNLCGITVKYKHSLFEHQQRHYSDKKCKCPECPFKAICEADIRKHIRRHHRQTKKYTCDVCNKSFKQKVHLLRHHTAIHTRDKDFCCSQCTYRCNDKSNLAKHMWHVHKLKERVKPLLVKFDRDPEPEEPIVKAVDVQTFVPQNEVQLEVETEPSETIIASSNVYVNVETSSEVIQDVAQVEQIEHVTIPIQETYQMVQNVQYWS